MKKYGALLILLVGAAIGAAIVVYGPDYIEPLLPVVGAPAEGGIEGLVIKKRLEADRLLLTLKSPEGAILVTFKKRVPEIDLLVEEGDTVNLKLKGYRPFVDDPGINRVMKPGPREEAPAQMEEILPQKEEGPPPTEPAETKQPAVEEETAPMTNSTL